MANKLKYNDLLKYMEVVFDMEKNVYVELKAWQELQGQINSLGIAKTYREPMKEANPNIFLNSLVYIFMGAFLGVAAFFVSTVVFVVVDIFFYVIDLRITIFIGVIAWILAIIINIVRDIKAINDIKNNYNNELSTYNQNISDDQARVQRELVQKQYLQSQCDTLAAMWRTSKEKLDKMYSYDILEEKYRNIVAVASIYEYLKYEMTRSLQRDGNDEGAYNIYERNIRLDKIITNTDIIIQKLDVVIENQRELAQAMKNAQNSINNLVSSTNNMFATMQSGMNKLNANVELNNYQHQQTNNELRYMNFMNTLHFYN